MPVPWDSVVDMIFLGSPLPTSMVNQSDPTSRLMASTKRVNNTRMLVTFFLEYSNALGESWGIH